MACTDIAFPSRSGAVDVSLWPSGITVCSSLVLLACLRKSSHCVKMFEASNRQVEFDGSAEKPAQLRRRELKVKKGRTRNIRGRQKQEIVDLGSKAGLQRSTAQLQNVMHLKDYKDYKRKRDSNPDLWMLKFKVPLSRGPILALLVQCETRGRFEPYSWKYRTNI